MLFRLLCLSLLASARTMAAASWDERAHVLNQAGYARYDERTSTMLGDSARLLLERWDGDLRRLRDEAERRRSAERRLLKEFSGLGDVGVDIFFREVQLAWGELRPFVDGRALRAAGRLGLGHSPEEVAGLVPEEQLAALVAALVRAELAKDYDLGSRAV